MKDVSREYYSMTDFAVSRVAEFLTQTEATEGFMDKARELYPGLTKDGTSRFLYYFDLVRCYNKLGYEPDLSRKEGLALFLSIFSGSIALKDSSYDILDAMIAAGTDAFCSVVASISKQLPLIPDEHDFLIADVISRSGGKVEDRKRYNVLLYRLCSVIAKADGRISGSESAWLATLLKASETASGKAGKNTGDTAPERSSHLPASSTPAATEDGILGSAAIKELDALIGLEKVKKEVHTLANFALVQKRRADRGLKATPLSMHLIFSGNPGTGKTTVARIMGRIYKDLGLLETGHLVEADRSDLVAEYVGQTAIKTNKVIDSAMGGVLFIDEAYSLVNSAKEDFGAEAISTLLKRMEDSRNRIAVILAGYTDRMDAFLSSNPGLSSRFSRKILFEDYSPEDLFSIYRMQLEKYDYRLPPDAAAKVRQTISKAVEARSADFGNGRYARNLFERTIESQANRVAYLADADEKTLCTIEPADVEGL